MTSYTQIRYAVEGPVGRVILNRPNVRNAQSRVLREEMDAAFARAMDDDAVRVVVLAGEGDQIKESLIAIEVYGRRPDYNPQVDSTVRVEAGRLRARLRQYYESSGAGDVIRIELPKGTYAPVFHHAEQLSAAAAPVASTTHPGTARIASGPAKPDRTRRPQLQEPDSPDARTHRSTSGAATRPVP